MFCFLAHPRDLGGNWLFAIVLSLALSPGHWPLWSLGHVNVWLKPRFFCMPPSTEDQHQTWPGGCQLSIMPHSSVGS